MTSAADRLARSRLAILQQLERREKNRENPFKAQARARRGAAAADPGSAQAQEDRMEQNAEEAGRRAGRRARRRGAGWFGSARAAFDTWWRHHPAHMAVEVATPVLSAYARRKPLQFLGIAAGAGALIAVARPWRLMSATGLLVAILKSGQISSLVMSAMSAADLDEDAPYDDA